jgi:hypothetical protein
VYAFPWIASPTVTYLCTHSRVIELVQAFVRDSDT